MRRVLHLIMGLDRGGAERLLVSNARHADRSRFALEVAYVAPEHHAVVSELEQAGVPVHCLGGGLRWPWRLAALVRERRVELVHAHSPAVASAARLALLRAPVRMVYTEHNVWASYRTAACWANRLTFGCNDHVFAVSDAVAASVRRRRLGRRGPPVEVCYQGIDPAEPGGWVASDDLRTELRIEPHCLVAGAVGNFRPEKGHEHLVRAAALVRSRVPDARFVLVGEGPLEARLRRLAAELGVSDVVRFAGSRGEGPARVAGGFDVLVAPSIHEGLGIAVVEAMALGKPAVVTETGGLPELVRDGREGRVVAPGDPRALADAIVALLTDEELRRRMGEAALARAADFDVRTSVSRAEAVYGELLG